MKKTKTIPRGIRNNNPLNIRIGNAWLGEVEHPTDKAFEQFVDMKFGIRAGFVLLKRYITRYHLTSVTLIVSRWAPRNENATDLYIRRVCLDMGIGPHDTLSFSDQDCMCKLVNAMILVECGQRVDMSVISLGYYLANS